MSSIISAPTCDLIIVGLTGSGKSTLAKHLANVTGTPIIEVGQIVMRDAAACRKCNSPPEHASHLIGSGNYFRFVEKVVKAVGDYGVPTIIVGPRHPLEVEFLRQSLRVPLIMGLDLPDSVRRFRYELPSDVRNVVKDKVEFYKRDALERSWGARYSLYMAQALLDATLSPAELQGLALDMWSRLSLRDGHQFCAYGNPESELVTPDEKLISEPDSFKSLVVAAAEHYRFEKSRNRRADTLRDESAACTSKHEF